ncbi:unnamed protein product [Allacma fusca]|uniref:Uncharacterized protein n=1 Tax=Allacma fusca TaxID=39272 RepID=A0A8J2KI78_9HEXA|nr:unnamed protein product [Allacma fusca]
MAYNNNYDYVVDIPFLRDFLGILRLNNCELGRAVTNICLAVVRLNNESIPGKSRERVKRVTSVSMATNHWSKDWNDNHLRIIPCHFPLLPSKTESSNKSTLPILTTAFPSPGVVGRDRICSGKFHPGMLENCGQENEIRANRRNDGIIITCNRSERPC